MLKQRVTLLSIMFWLLMVVVPTSGWAIPLPGSYEFNSPALAISGQFTVAATNILSDWDFTHAPSAARWTGTNFTGVLGGTVFWNDSDLFIQGDNSLLQPRFIIRWDLGNAAYFAPGATGAQAQAFTVAPIPEPSTILLLTTGLLSLAGYRWHQRGREGVQSV